LTEEPGFRFLEHMTDAEIEVYGRNLNEAFENAARAVESMMVDLASVRTTERRVIRVSGKDLGALLYAWIESLISLEDTDSLLFSEFNCEVLQSSNGSWQLLATVHGDKFDPERHEERTAVKAPTYHDMKISIDEKQRVTMRFLVDL
jgi:SHS2 domain-containing protein